ncbi:uncharacterized protein LOC144475266 [Augochlora pura]
MYRYCALIDPVVICPYNKSHLIAKSRIQKHIVKCEKNYPDNYKVMCPYDATHRLFQEEFEEHIITCPSRNVVQSDMYIDPKNHGCITFPMPSEISSTVDDTENWDFEPNTSSNLVDDDSISNNNTDLPLTNRHIYKKENLRPPRGFPEAMMTECNEDSAVEDTESVYSALGLGRGKFLRKQMQMKLLGKNRSGT